MFYAWAPNYGVAILLLTLLSKIVTLPLTLKSSRSMARMKLLQPKIQAVREKYKSDPVNMNKAVMNMYREEGVNPIGAGGCLPMILQMPVFISLFVTLRKSIELRGAPFMLWINDLSGPEALFMLPGKILFYGPNVSLLTIIMAVTMYFQQKQTMTDPKQRSMVILMPVIMLFMLNSMPSGLMLYWAFSNVLGIVQNAFIKPDKLPPPKPKKKKKRFKPLSYNEMLKKMRGSR
jgi:YidC/Oxa1 family membrane protein insertase